MHVGARVEDAVQARVASILRRRGWTPRVLPYTGYGAHGRVRLLARVLLTPPGGGARDAARGWRSYLSLPVPDARVGAVVGGRRHTLTSDRGGYVDMTVPAELEPGWREVLLSVPGGPDVRADVRVVDPASEVVVVSDIDDTVMVTYLPRPLVAAWNSFVRHEHARRPVPGMSRLLAQVVAELGDAPVLYLSTGAWNVAPTLRRFLAAHGFPPGPLLLTDWGPTPTGWFRDGAAHKRDALARLVSELPGVRFLLVGDDGQRDPQVYGELADRVPERVLAVAIRQLTAGEQALARGLGPGPVRGEDGTLVPHPVPWLAAPDGDGLLQALRRRGLLGPAGTARAPQRGTGAPRSTSRPSASS